MLLTSHAFHVISIKVPLTCSYKEFEKNLCRIFKEDIICKDKSCLATGKNILATSLCFPLIKMPGAMNMYDM